MWYSGMKVKKRKKENKWPKTDKEKLTKTIREREQETHGERKKGICGSEYKLKGQARGQEKWRTVNR